MDIPHEKQFHFRDGSSAGSVEELKAKLERISYQEFYHHVNSEKNDFANWVRHVLGNADLADNLQKVTSIVETIDMLDDALGPHAENPESIQTMIEESVETHQLPVEEVPITTTAQVPEEPVEVADMEVLHEAVEQPEEPAEQAQVVLTPRERTRLIVTDFMYGMIFGLFVGFLLGRILL